MRILLLSAEYPPQIGGVGDYTCRLASALAEADHEVAVLSAIGEGPEIPADLSQPFAVLRRVRSWGWSLAAAVRDVIDELRPDVLHIQYQTGAYGMHPAINLLPRRLGRRRPAVAVTFHDLYMPYLLPKAGPLRRWVTRQLLDYADAVVVTNEDDLQRLAGHGESDPRRYLARRPPRSKLSLIHIGSNIRFQIPADFQRWQVRQALGADQRSMLLAYFGLLSYTKGLDLLLEALAGLPEHFRLVVIGGEATTAEDRRFAAGIVEQIAHLDLLDRVQITGQLAEADVTEHLLAADMAVLPFRDGASYRRGSLLAALSHGVATITTRPPLPLSPPLDGAGYLVPPGDVPALRDAIVTLAGDATLRYTLSDRGMALASTFDWSSIARRHEELYGSLLSDARLSLVAE